MPPSPASRAGHLVSTVADKGTGNHLFLRHCLQIRLLISLLHRLKHQKNFMNNRGRKRRHPLRQRKNARLPADSILKAEDKAWLDMPPVGREFGSREFEEEILKKSDRTC